MKFDAHRTRAMDRTRSVMKPLVAILEHLVFYQLAILSDLSSRDAVNSCYGALTTAFISSFEH